MIVSRVVRWVSVQVSSVTMTVSGSTGNAGRSDTRIGLKAGGGEGGTPDGRGGTTSLSSKLGADLIFNDGRKDGERGTGTETGTEAGIAASSLGVRGLLLPELLLESITSSSDSGKGRGGRGGLLMTDSKEGGVKDLEIEGFLFLDLEDSDLWGRSSDDLDSRLGRDGISRRASSGVRTTVAPLPRTPLRCCVNESMPRTNLGSEMRTGLGAA